MRGSIGNRAIGFALEALGHNAWLVPTIVLPWHPGHGPSTRLNFDAGAFGTALEELGDSKWHSEISAVLTGYFSDTAQVTAAAKLISKLKQQNPELLYLCDPVIGDARGLYVPEPIAASIRDELLPLADIATPNRYELAWLTSAELADNRAIGQAVTTLGIPQVVVTSAYAMMRGSIANLYLAEGTAKLAEHREIESIPNGPGDLFSAVFLGRLLSGESGTQALELSVACVYEIAMQSVRAGLDELALEAGHAFIRQPSLRIQMRDLVL